MLQQKSLRRRLALAAVLAITFGLIWAVVATSFAEVLSQIERANLPHHMYERLEVMSDGSPLIRRYDAREWPYYTYRDLEGNSVEPTEGEDGLRGGNLWSTSVRLPPFPIFASIKRLRVFHDGREPRAYWYFFHDGRKDGLGYFVGYDTRSKLRIGYLGTNGFRSDSVPLAERFPVRRDVMQDMSCYWSAEMSRNHYVTEGKIVFVGIVSKSDQFPSWHVYVPSGNQLYQVDLQQRTVESRLDVESPILRIAFVTRSVEKFEEGFDYRLALRTAKTIRVFDMKNDTLREHPVPAELRGKSFTWYELADGKALATVYGNLNEEEGTNSVTLYWISADGGVEQTKHVVLHYTPTVSERMHRSLMALFFPTHVVITTTAVVLEPWLKSVTSETEDYPAALAKSLSYYWPGLLVLSVASVVLSVWCYRHQTRFSVTGTERVVWCVFVFLFGVPGLAGYLLHRRWPVREVCDKCRFEAPRDDDSCHTCGTLFPEPASKGIEVFA